MSLVGTRPPTVDEWEKYELHHRARLAAKPGLTGMWQVSGRSNITDFEEVVEEYASIAEVDEYPVIVKPTDRAGSIGISIAHNLDELEKAYQYAYDLSIEKRVIIEKYIQDADKVDFYYLAENGNLTLLTSCDTVNAQNNDGARVVQTAWLYPEKYQSSYDVKVKDSIEAMIRGMKIEYGCIFFSGFIDKNHNFVFFECGYRLEGAHQYYYNIHFD